MNIEVDLTNCDREPIHIPGTYRNPKSHAPQA